MSYKDTETSIIILPDVARFNVVVFTITGSSFPLLVVRHTETKVASSITVYSGTSKFMIKAV